MPEHDSKRSESAFHLLLRGVPGQHPLDVFGQNIELDVHPVTSLQDVDVGVSFGVRNYPDCETFREELGDRQTDSIDGDGPFVSRIVGEVRRQFDLKPMIGPASFERNDFRAAINVPLNEVAAQWRAGNKRAFEIYQTLAPKLFQVGAVQRFFEKIERELVLALSADR